MNNNEVICPNCSQPNSIDSAFCAFCGASLKEVVEKKKAEILKNQLPPEELNYQKAQQLMSNGNFDQALPIFESLGLYKDAKEKADFASKTINDRQEAQTQAAYNKALAAFGAGDLATAQSLFSQLGNYSDSADKLAIVNKAMDSKRASEIENQYQNGIQLTNNARSSKDIAQVIQYFEALGNYKDSPAIVKSLTEKYNAQIQIEQAQKNKRNKKIKLFSILAVLIALIAGGSVMGVKYMQNKAEELQSQVATQRDANKKSYQNLDPDVQGNIKSMMTTLGGNKYDYTYKVTNKTDDVVFVKYKFISPDKNNDVLPENQTTMYESTAMYRE